MTTKAKAKAKAKPKAKAGRKPNGMFATGNCIWKARSTCGIDPKFASPEDLWKAAQEYFQWVDDNPLWMEKVVSSKDGPETISVPKMQAMTIQGLCIFLNINRDTWYDWRNNRPDLSDIIARVEMIIRTQKFTGAAADLLNPNIIARDLGLADKQTHANDPDHPLVPEPADDRKLAQAVAHLLAKGMM